MEFLTSNQAAAEMLPVMVVSFIVFMAGYAVGRYGEDPKGQTRVIKVKMLGDKRIGQWVSYHDLGPHKFDPRFCDKGCTVMENQDPYNQDKTEGPAR